MVLDKLKTFLYSFFHYIYIGVFTLTLLIVFIYKEGLTSKIAMIIGVMAITILFIFLYRYIMHSHIIEKWSFKHLALIFGIFIIVQVIFGVLLRVKPSWDFGYVYAEAVNLAKSGSWNISDTSYFLMYPNNQFYLLILTIVFKIVSLFNVTSFVITGVITNIIFIDISLLIFHLCLKRIWNKKIAFFGLFISMLCCVYITYIPIFYTDTFPLPLSNVGLLLYIIIIKEKNILKTGIYSALLGFTTMLAFELKATAIILLIAIILHAIFTMKSKKMLILIGISVISLLGSIKGYEYAFNHIINLDSRLYDRYNFPYTHWLMMGLKTPGGYNEEDFHYTLSFHTKKEKQDAQVEVIKERLEEKGIVGLVEHFIKKINFTWNDGAYFSQELLSRKPIGDNLVQDYYVKGGNFEFIHEFLSDSIHYSIITLMIISAINGLKKKKEESSFDFISCVRLSIFGLFVFLLIWETKSKYLVNFIPFMYIVAIDGVDYLYKQLRRKTV